MKVGRQAVLLVLLVVVPTTVAFALTPATPVAERSTNVDAGTHISASEGRIPESRTTLTATRTTDGFRRTNGGFDASTDTDRRATNGTIERLELNATDQTTSYVIAAPDVGGTVVAADSELSDGYRMYRYRYRLANADNGTDRQRLVERTVEYGTRRLDALRESRRVAIRAYYRGRIQERELLRTLVEIDARAGVVDGGLDEIKPYAKENIPLENLQRGLRSLQGKIYDRIRAGFNGTDGPTLVHVTAADNGFVLKTIEDGAYYRTAVRFDNLGSGNGVGTIRPIRHVSTLYPDTTIPGRYRFRINPTNERHLLQVEFGHPQGHNDVYLDTRTRRLYVERQRLTLERLPTTPIANGRDAHVVVSVSRTEEGDPILVNVTDATTGDPLDGVVRIDGRWIGRTGADGELWTVGSRRSFTVSVVTGRQTVNVSVPGTGGT